MPQKVVCESCDEVLYEGNLLKSYMDVYKEYDGRCPKCKRDLDYENPKFKVGPAE